MKKEEQKDFNQVPIELTPKWWEKQFLTTNQFIVIPDFAYDNPVIGISYESSEEGDGIDYNTGVIVGGSIDYKDFIGNWCHYKKHGPYTFHPFRERFSNGEKSEIEKKPALRISPEDIVLITDKKIF